MIDFDVEKSATLDFINIRGNFYHHISTLYNPDFVINLSNHQYSFSFFGKEIIACEISGNKIVGIKAFEYKDFISDSFLNILLSMDSLPSRLERYRRIGIERLREEIIDELLLGSIVSEGTEALWVDYQLKLSISSVSLCMENIFV